MIVMMIVHVLVQMLSAVQDLSSSQDFHVRRCMTLTFDPQ